MKRVDTQEIVLRLTREEAQALLEDEDLCLHEHWADPAEMDCWLCKLADQLRSGLEAA